MDLYNPMWWSGQAGKYTVWKSVYPPLNFVFFDILRWLFYSGVSYADATALRGASLLPAYVMAAAAVSGVAVAVTSSDWHSWSVVDRALIAAAAVLSPVYLFEIERANIIIISIFFIAIIFSKSHQSVKNVSLSILVNIKPYFAVFIIWFLVKRDFKSFFMSISASFFVYVISGLYSAADFPAMVGNIFHFSNVSNNLFSPQTCLSLSSNFAFTALAAKTLLATSVMSVFHVAILKVVYYGASITRTVVVLFGLYVLWRSRRVMTTEQAFVLLALIMFNYGLWAPGYVLTLYIVFVPTLARMRHPVIPILMVAAIFLPTDLVSIYVSPHAYKVYSFLSNHDVYYRWQLGLGGVARPVFNAILLASVSYNLLALRKERECSGAQMVAMEV